MAALTDPYPADLDLLQPLGHEFRATVWPPNIPPFELAVVGPPRLEYSRSWAPYAQASFKAVRPADPKQWDALDPRRKTYVHLDLGYRTAAGATVPNVAMLRLDRAEPDAEGVLDITLLGMESTAQEASWLRDWDGLIPRSGIVEALTFLIRQGTTGFQRTVMSSLPNGYRADLLVTDLDEWGTPLPLHSDGTRIWSAIDSLAAQANLKVWEDGLKVWHIEPRGQAGSVPAMVLSDGPGGVVTAGTFRRSREGWYNSVLLSFPDAPPRKDLRADREIRAYASGGGSYHPSLVGAVTWTGSRPGYATEASAAVAARALLRTFLGRGHLYRMEAVAAYWLRPGMAVDVRIQGTRSRQIVESVKFRPWDGLMDVETTPDALEED